MVVRKKQKYEFWIDKVAKEVIEREKKLKRGIKTIRTEMGIGASGIPHVGSVGDGIRAYGVKLGIENLGKKSELIAYSDTRDGLRKVPSGLPDWLEKHIGQPVTDIPDPFGGCHKNYGEHMSSLLIDAFEKLGVKFVFLSGADVYKKGLLNEQIEKILINSEKIGRIVKKITGQEKFLESLPYFPVCESCGKIYTTRAYKLLPKEHKVLYKCDQQFIGKNNNTGKEIVVNGCGHEGEANYFNGNGKLGWKVEFAARWAALKISFEAYGKDIADSVAVNDAICKEILGFEPPIHIMYELFLEKSGRKISKSAGNVFTPQVWMRYGNPQSLILLMLKRFEGTRELDVTDIPKYVNEVDNLEKIFFGIKKIDDIRELTNSKRIFEYIHLLKPLKKVGFNFEFEKMLELAKVAPEKNGIDFILGKLKEYGTVEKISKDLEKEVEHRFTFAKNWIQDFEKEEVKQVEMSPRMKVAIRDLIEIIKTSENENDLQNKIFQVANQNKVQPRELFRAVYLILLNSERGPRLAPYIFEIGKEEIIRKLENSVK